MAKEVTVGEVIAHSAKNAAKAAANGAVIATPIAITVFAVVALKTIVKGK